uniref:Uncharacterized protein n=1 Tax=Arundo donax TaxID=35708 RepID=A0A0A9AU56_ARUDO
MGCLSFVQAAIFLESRLHFPSLVQLELFRAHFLNSLAWRSISIL